jgi:putative resolvase
MKLSSYARKAGVHYYHTAWRWFKSGQLKGYQMDTGTIIITEDDEPRPPDKVAIYTRVSSHEMRKNLNRQAERLSDYCAAKGWQVHKVIKEVGSGVNDKRKQFLKILADPSFTIMVVEHKDRATRFGFNYLDTLLSRQGRRIEVVNLADNGQEDLRHDLVAIIYSFCAGLYGQRRAKRKTEKISAELTKDADTDESAKE